MTTGKRIRELRGLQKLDDFSANFKISPQQISRLENDKSGISPELAIAICDFYNCSLDWLLRGIEPREANKKINKIEEPPTEYVPMSKHLEVLEKYNKLLEEQIEKQEERIEKQDEKIRSNELQSQ